jgi:hypothetical protein
MRVQVSKEMQLVDARRLPAPVLEYGQPKAMDVGTMGEWNLRSVKLFHTLPLESWAVVCLPGREELDVEGSGSIFRFMDVGEHGSNA